MGWLDKKWNWKRNRVVFLCDHPFLIRKNHWFLDESIKTKLPTMLISCSFLSLISAALVHFPSTRVGPTSLGKVIEKSSTGLCRPLHYSFSTGSEGWQFVWFRSDQIRSVAQSCPTLCNPHESQHARPPCPSPTHGVHWDSCPSSQWCHPAISSSVVLFSSCPQSLPASESFPMSQLDYNYFISYVRMSINLHGWLTSDFS